MLKFQPLYRALLTLPTLFALAGCAARINQFNTFAQTGIKYEKASQSVIQAAGTTAVNTDSALLIKERPHLDPANRRKFVIQSDALLEQRLHVLHLISIHGELLEQYFEALASLSDPKAPNSVGTAAQQIYNSLAKMRPALKNAKVGSVTVSNFIPTVIAPAVATFRVHALNRELKARADLIAKELALQQAAFLAIESEMKTDAQEQHNLMETNSIDQFAASTPLPATWASQRLALLSTPAAVASAEAAADASAQLRTAFTAVVENRSDSADFASLMTDVSHMLTLAQNIKGTAK